MRGPSSAARFARRWRVPLTVKRVSVRKAGRGLEAAARDARYGAFNEIDADVIALAHNLDDQAETVLMNLLRGAGARGASGMSERARLRGKSLRPAAAGYDPEGNPRLCPQARPRVDRGREQRRRIADAQLHPPQRRTAAREEIPAVAAESRPGREALLAARRSAREDLLREFLRSKGLKAPSEAKLVEMLKQLGSGGARTLIEHDGARLRVYRNEVRFEQRAEAFAPIPWQGRAADRDSGRRAAVQARARRGDRSRRGEGRGLFASALRSGGERLQLHPRRPRRTLKNLFQEAGVPPWERERLPLLYCGDALAVGAAASASTSASERCRSASAGFPNGDLSRCFYEIREAGRDRIARLAC